VLFGAAILADTTLTDSISKFGGVLAAVAVFFAIVLIVFFAAGRAAGVGTLVLFDPATGETRRDGDVWVVPNLGAATELLHSTPAG